MPNIWWISHVRPIRAELTDPKEMEFCSCSPHSSSPGSTFLLLLLAVFSSCPPVNPMVHPGVETFIFSSAAALQTSEVTELFLLDGRTTEKKGDTQEEGKKAEEGK